MTTITINLDAEPLEAMARKLGTTVAVVLEMLSIEVDVGMIPASEPVESEEK
jgi:hypothetical protein